MEASGGVNAYVELRKFTVGLIDRLEVYFNRSLDIQKDLKGERCPGEEKCKVTPWKPLNQARGADPATVCPGCRLYSTKPGQQPRDLVDAISTGLRLDNLKECGATFAYPDGLTAYEWACLQGLNAGRAAWTEKDRYKAQAAADQQSAQARLAQRVTTGAPTRPVI